MTNLIRLSPSNEMRRMQREIDRLFENFFPVRNENGEVEAATWAPRVDLVETEEAYVIHLDVPGMKKSDFTINYQDYTLSISGERTLPEPAENQNLVRVERAFGHFFRSFSLPKVVKENEISASYQDGVLSIRVPKAEESKPRRIEIQ